MQSHVGISDQRKLEILAQLDADRHRRYGTVTRDLGVITASNVKIQRGSLLVYYNGVVDSIISGSNMYLKGGHHLFKCHL